MVHCSLRWLSFSKKKRLIRISLPPVNPHSRFFPPSCSSFHEIFFLLYQRENKVSSVWHLKVKEWNWRLLGRDKSRLGKREVGSSARSASQRCVLPPSTRCLLHLNDTIIHRQESGVLKVPPKNHLQLNTDIILEI